MLRENSSISYRSAVVEIASRLIDGGRLMGRYRLDLPILQVDGGAAPQEMDDRDELVSFAPAHHLTHDPAQRAGHDSDSGTYRHRGFRRNG